MRRFQLPLLLALALGVAAGAHAQAKPQPQAPSKRDPAMLPVWNNTSGKVEAVLLLEPTGEAAAGARWRIGSNTLGAAFGLESGDSLGLVCSRRPEIASSIGSLISNCALAEMIGDDEGSQRLGASATLSRPGGKLGLSAGSGRDTLPSWLSAGAGARVEQNDLAVFGQKNLGREGYVRIGGAVARASLIPIAEMPGMADRWNSRSVSVGGGFGAFSGNIVGRVVDAPGQPGKWEALGLGLTWRTPWSGQLTVGAENVITRGKNPFSPSTAATDEGTVPYVRYQQDL